MMFMKKKIISAIKNNLLDNNNKQNFFSYDNIPCAIILTKPNGKIVYANQFAENILNIKKEILLASTLFNLTLKQNHENIKKALDISYKKQKVQNLVVPVIQGKDSKNKFFEIALNKSLSNEIIIRFSEIKQTNELDIKLIEKTEFFEKEANENKNLLSQIIDNLPVALFIKKYPEGKYVTWNKKSEEIFNRKAEDVIGKTKHDEITKDQDTFFTDQDKKVFDTKQDLKIPKEIISTKKDSVRILHTTKTPVFNKDGDPLYLIGMSDDITQKTKTEKRLKETNSKYQMLMENIKKGVVIIQQEKIIFANSFMATLLKKPENDLMGLNIFDIIPPKNTSAMKEILEQITNPLFNQKTCNFYDIELQNTIGETIPLIFYGTESIHLGKKVIICFFRTKKNTFAKKDSDKEKELLSKFQNIFYYNNHPLAVMNSTGYLSSLNEKGQETFGFTKEDRNFYTNIYIMPMFKLHARKLLVQNKETNTIASIDFDKLKKQFPNRIRKSGKLNLQLSLTPLNIENKNTDWLISIKEPCEQKDMQISSKTKVACFNQPFFICNENREILDYNLPAKELLFFNNNIEGLKLENIFAQKNNKEIKNIFHDLKELKTIKNKIYLLKQERENGSFKNLEVNISASQIASKNPKKPINYIFIINNIEPKKDALDTLKLQNRKHQALLKCVEDIICFTEIKNNNTFANFKDIYNPNNFLGYTKKELEMLNLEDILSNPKKGNTKEAKIFLKNTISKLNDTPAFSFITKAYNKDKKEITIKVWLSKVNSNNKNQLLIVLRDITSSYSCDTILQKKDTELQNLISTLPDMYIKTDIEGNIADYLTNKKTFDKTISIKDALKENIKNIVPESLYENIIFNIKESLSNNSFNLETYKYKTKSSEKYIEVQFIPLIKEQQVAILIKQANYKIEFETKLQNLSKVAIGNDDKFTEKLDSILALGQKIFKTETAFLMRFIDEDTGYIAYSSNNTIFRRGEMHVIPKFVRQVLDDKIISSQNIDQTDLKNTMLSDKNIKSVISAPIYISSKIKGCLCFADTKINIQETNIDKEFLGLIATLISQSLEIRQDNKLLSSRKNIFKYMLDDLETPSLIIDDKYKIEYINSNFEDLVDAEIKSLKGKNFFKKFFPNSNTQAEHDFENEYLTTKENTFQIYGQMLLGKKDYININLRCMVLENKFGKAESYVLILEKHL